MKLEQRYSAERLANIALYSSVGVLLACTATFLPPAVFGLAEHPLACFISLLAIGIAAAFPMYLATEAFKRGVADERWDKDTLDRLYDRLNHPIWKRLTVVSIVAMLAYVVWLLCSGPSPHHHFINGGLFYFWVSPLTTVGHLRLAIRPKATGPGPSIWATGVRPLTSDHWGQR